MTWLEYAIAAAWVTSVACLPWRWLLNAYARLNQTLQSASSKYAHLLLRYVPPTLLGAWAQAPRPRARLAGCVLTLLGILWALVLMAWLWWLISVVLIALLLLPINRRIRQYQRDLVAIQSALPGQLDMLAMLLSAGQPLLSSIEQCAQGPAVHPLQLELARLVSRVRAGIPLQQALTQLAETYRCRELRLFVHAVRHTRESGSGLAVILQQQAEQRREEIFLAVERKAMEAPVKMMFPLLCFIFPATILVLVVTLAAKVMWGL